MIEVHYWPTPNGHKVGIFLEEAGLDYEFVPINIGKGDQFNPEFLAISPNNRIPAIIDKKPLDDGDPITVFESGAILIYLAEKTGKFLPHDIRGRTCVLEWLMWQMGGLGPMSGQNHHFSNYAPEKLPYAIDRYTKETNRLYGVLNKQLAGKNYICGEYSIADMACYPWTLNWKTQGQDIDDFPNLKAWQESIRARPAVERAYAKGTPLRPNPGMSEEDKKVLFGQTAATVR